MAKITDVSLPDRTDDVRAILTGEALFKSDRQTQWRLEELREHWDGTDETLAVSLVHLVENGEIALFPMGDVTKIRRESL